MNEDLLKELADLATKYNVQLFGNVQTSEGTEPFVVGTPQGSVTVKESELERLKTLLSENNIKF